jgi:hypothetical protein
MKPSLQLNVSNSPSYDDPKKLKWIVEFEIAEHLVRDGFIITSERALEMLNYTGTLSDSTANVISSPDIWTLARIQGHKSVKEFLTESHLRVTKDGIVEEQYDS